MARRIQKPGLTEWLHAAGVVIDRLTDCVHVYKKPPYVDVFMADAERQKKTDQTIQFLHRIYTLLDQADSLGTRKRDDEAMISKTIPLLREALRMLPTLSNDMQKLLKSPWMKSFPNKIAETLFFGNGKEAEGIGSGQPEHGRLPAALESLLEREQLGTSHPTEQMFTPASEPHRHDPEPRAQWADRNSHFLRTAGRVE